jgi:integrase
MKDDERKRGGGFVFAKPGSRYLHAQWYVDGQRHRGSTGQTDRATAEAWLGDKLGRIRHGDEAPREDRVTVDDLWRLLRDNYELRRNRSLRIIRYPWKHLVAFFGLRARAVKLGHRLDEYVGHRRAEGAADATIRYELSLLDRAYQLAVTKKQISSRSRPVIEKPAEDPSRVRTGFFTRTEVESLCGHLPPDLADVVQFLFFSAWRVNEVRSLEWRDYFAEDGMIRLRPEFSKNKHDRKLPIDRGELAAIVMRRLEARRQHPECPYIFHRDGRRIGDFRKTWKRACDAIGLPGRIVHDLRRSGVKHLIGAGNDPHTVMQFSGHRTRSTLDRYHIIDLDDLRVAAERASDFRGTPRRVTTLHGEQPQFSPRSQKSSASTGRRS